MKKLVIIMAIATAFSMVGCSKSNDEKGNYVKLDDVRYDITSAFYFVDNGNLTIQLETAEPDVFIYFKGKSSIPLGETNVSYESLDDNCIVTYCFENEDYLSIDGNVTLSLDGGDYTMEAEGHVFSLTSSDRDFKIHYVGDISQVNLSGSGGGSGNGNSGGGIHTSDKIMVSPAFSYYDSNGGKGHIDVYCANDNLAWSAKSDSDWCQIIDNANGIGNSSIEITITKNLSIVDRSAKITFTSEDGKTTQSAYIFQHSGGYDMVVKPERLESGAFGNTEGSAQIIHVYIYTGNVSYPLHWEVSGVPSWAQLSATSGTTNTDIRVVVDKNNMSKERVATLRFESENHTVRYVTLYQKSGSGGNGNFKVSITHAEYQINPNNNMVVKVRYYIKNQSTSATLYYLKFNATHPSGYVDRNREIGSKDNASQWTLAPGNGTYTNYFNVSFPYKDGNISGEILDWAFD